MSVHLSIVMMQKDEGELLKAWCYHHLGITDASNICIFDNGSTCKKTLIILKEAEIKEKTEIVNNPKCLLILKGEKKISRNERCEATGKKFKNCCGAL